MPNLSDPFDYDLSAIEAAIKETARGRMFLAGYARRIRQSDTMTLLAMLNRLERWCQNQAVRFAELDGRSLISLGEVPVAGRQGRMGVQGITGGEPRSDSSEVSNLSDGFGDRRLVTDVGNHDIEQRSKVEFSGREVMRRLEELAATLSELDRRTADLAVRFGGADNLSSPKATDHSTPGYDECANIASSGRGSSASTGEENQTHETNVLDGIAKALRDVV